MSYKRGDATEFTPASTTQKHLKTITDTHFVWLDYDVDTKKVTAGSGGPYTFVGDTYTETTEFDINGMQSYLGQKPIFTMKFEGDAFTQSGQLPARHH